MVTFLDTTSAAEVLCVQCELFCARLDCGRIGYNRPVQLISFFGSNFSPNKTSELLFEIFIFPPNCSSISLQHSRSVGFVEVSRQKVCAEEKPVNGQNFIIFIY